MNERIPLYLPLIFPAEMTAWILSMSKVHDVTPLMVLLSTFKFAFDNQDAEVDEAMECLRKAPLTYRVSRFELDVQVCTKFRADLF